MYIKNQLFTLLILWAANGFAQNELKPITSRPHYLSIQWFGVTYHPGGGSVFMRDNYPLRLDPKAYFVLNVGAAVSYDKDLSKRFFLRSQAGFLMDCAWQKSAYVHVGLHFNAFTRGKHSINGGLGPMFLVREDWGKFERYRRGDDFFGDRLKMGWQYRFFPIGGEAEYLYQINKKWAFQYSVVPAYPAVVTSKIGLRIKL
jgi:hypothetical protein